MIPEFDIITTATLRPDILKLTFDSHVENLFGDNIKQANLKINIDKAGADNNHYEIIQEMIDYIDSIPFKSVCINVPETPSFPRAFYWGLTQLTSDYTFILEDDWELNRKTNFERMFDLFQADEKLVHLRLSHFWSNEESRMKTWNKFLDWNGSYFSVPRDLRRIVGFAGHPSLNMTAFLLYFKGIMDPESNPEKQIKGNHPIILDNHFGVFHPKTSTPPAENDLGRKWMIANGFRKEGSKAFFKTWRDISEVAK